MPTPETADVPRDAEQELRRRTRLALAVAAMEKREDLFALVATYGENFGPDGAYSALAVRSRALEVRLRVLAVLCDRIVSGASWETIGRLLRLTAEEAEGIYGPMEARWRAGDAAPWAPNLAEVEGAEGVIAALEPTLPIDLTPGRIAALPGELDEYCARFLGAEHQDTRKGAVSPGLPR